MVRRWGMIWGYWGHQVHLQVVMILFYHWILLMEWWKDELVGQREIPCAVIPSHPSAHLWLPLFIAPSSLFQSLYAGCITWPPFWSRFSRRRRTKKKNKEEEEEKEENEKTPLSLDLIIIKFHPPLTLLPLFLFWGREVGGGEWFPASLSSSQSI